MENKFLLDKIKSPEDIKNVPLEDLNKLCNEIRDKIVETVSKNGGHLASNLGVVELTVALHRAFSTPKDKIVWDVGHQCYTHKILTGRLKDLDTIRKKDGISGFPKKDESKHDPLDSGHSSTSISAAFGLCKSNELLGKDGNVVAVIGDGALTGGLAYEGLNNAGRLKRNFIVVLNDNKMSISKNVGAIARYLTAIRTRPVYLHAKNRIETILLKMPLIGKPLLKLIFKFKSALKNILYKSTLFEDMGFLYYGPFDGHDIKRLVNVFNSAKKINRPVLIHVITKKGKGYHFAEKNPKVFHGISGFDVKTGKQALGKSSFSDVFGKQICNLASKDKSICAITAAMKLGTGLLDFSYEYKERFFDVGIAEGHAITFAGGLAAGGLKPVFSVYSTFLQRGYDQIIHDIALQKLHVVIAIDRAGVVGEDGETHQGVFDISMLNAIPNVTILSPSFYDEMNKMLYDAFYNYKNVVAVRYPRGGELFKPNDFKITCNTFDIYGENEVADIAVITYGRLFSCACKAKEALEKMGIKITIIKLNVIKPIDEAVFDVAKKYNKIFFFEESMQVGSVAEHFSYSLLQKKYNGTFIIKAIKDKFTPQASVKQTLKDLELDYEGIVKTIITECKQ